MKKTLIAIMLAASMTLVPATAQAKRKYIDYGEMRLTAYCPCDECSEGYGRKCAMPGHYCKSNHTIAVDPDVISLGSKVKIGDKIYVAEDTGGKIYGDRIDIFFDTHEEVVEFGVKYAKTKVVKGE